MYMCNYYDGHMFVTYNGEYKFLKFINCDMKTYVYPTILGHSPDGKAGYMKHSPIGYNVHYGREANLVVPAALMYHDIDTWRLG